MCGAGGSRGPLCAVKGTALCARVAGAARPLTALMPALGTAIHMRSKSRRFTGETLAYCQRSTARRFKLIGKAALNVLEPGGDHEITAVAEKRLYIGYEQVGFIEEVVCLRQL